MFEKVNPYHPDKVADRIAGAVVDLCYARTEGGIKSGNPRVAVEVLVGHGTATVIIETSLGRRELTAADVVDIVRRLCPDISTEQMHIMIAEQDRHLAQNQSRGLRCGDNGIFKGVPVTEEQRLLAYLAREVSEKFPADGKYIISRDENDLTSVVVCQSNASHNEIHYTLDDFFKLFPSCEYLKGAIITPTINPLGDWTGGTDVDCGATNRKLGSDMGDAVTGGGLHGKDLSKADVSVNIVCHQLAQISGGEEVTACCSIGDETVTFRYAGGEVRTTSFDEVVTLARRYIINQYDGSFEKFAEWGLI